MKQQRIIVRQTFFVLRQYVSLEGTTTMEALGHSSPCISINHGGTAEYITDACGFRIDPINREHIIEQIASKIELLGTNKELYEWMSGAAYEQAQIFLRENKVKELLEVYKQAIASKKPI